MNTDANLKNEEKVQFQLRTLYEQCGYSRFKMSKFEEYDLYVRNKDFLVSDSVITFTDTTGKLMALKPDVTLSIVKNSSSINGVQRVYYNENVYRVSEQTHTYKEIVQTGLECMGNISGYDLCEVLLLAAQSLQTISKDCVLNVSHLGVVSALLDAPEMADIRKDLFACIGEKNSHGVGELCVQAGIDQSVARQLQLLTTAYGTPGEVLPQLGFLDQYPAAAKALEELSLVINTLQKVSDVRICVDFSLVNNMKYYNGLVFRGFVNGVPAGVLSGGQYDYLMNRMGKNEKAIGFAVYLDLLERMDKEKEYDADVLLLYDDTVSFSQVLAEAQALRREGKSVEVQKNVPNKRRYRQQICLPVQKGETSCD